MSRKTHLSDDNFEDTKINLHYFKEVTSTMEVARKLAMADCPTMTVVLADTQTKGRGRLKRSWHSQAGGLYFTVILRPGLPLQQCSLLNFLASVVLTHVIKQQCDLSVAVKWPNDILFGTRKLAGMLSELITPKNQAAIFNIGIGLNVNNTPSQDEPSAISLKEILGRPISRRLIIEKFMSGLEKNLDPFDANHVLSEWKAHAITLNRQVTIETIQGTYQGLAVDIDKDGALILQMENGSLKTVFHGDCFISDPMSRNK
jgi:BirA family transcriptional regulator, biotin operon repressor / biotin---[acetyl-CoA-carboxylase] ligase